MLSEELGAQKDTIYRQIRTLEKSYRSCRSVGLSHELTPQRDKRRVDICRQFIGNPMDDIFIRRTIIVTCVEKCVSYRNPDASKQWLGPHQPSKVIL